MEFRILGPLEAVDGGRTLRVVGPKQRALLALLLLHANEVVSTDRLLEQLWGDPPPRAGSAALRVRISQLRKALEQRDVIVTRQPGYVLMAEGDTLDLHRFERLVEEARAAEPAAAAARLREALALFRGPPLADVAYEPFAQAAIGRLDELRLVALERRIEADLALGRHAELIGELKELAARHPLRERLRAQLMLALYRADRQVEALAEYQAARQVLVDDLGLDPSPTLQELERLVLRHDAALELRPADAPARSILVFGQNDSEFDPLLALAVPLARRPIRDLILAQVAAADTFARIGDDLARRRGDLQAQRVNARVAAFTSPDPGPDIVRLTSEQDVDLVLIAGAIDDVASTVLDRAMSDVGLLLTADKMPFAGFGGPIVVPFGGANHDWAAVEHATWLAMARGTSVRLVGVAGAKGDGDASRLLASVSLIVQRVAGIETEVGLVESGADGIVRAAEDASLVVFGLSAGWRKSGLGDVRSEVARRAAAPTLLVRKGVRPSGLAPASSLTQFTWSLRR